MSTPPFPDPQSGQLLNPEWDALFGFMVGRLLANGYTPAQIQVKTRNVCDLIRNAVRSPEGAEAGEEVRKGMDTLIDLVNDPEDPPS